MRNFVGYTKRPYFSSGSITMAGEEAFEEIYQIFGWSD